MAACIEHVHHAGGHTGLAVLIAVLNPCWIRVRLLVCVCLCLQMVLPEREFCCDFFANVCLVL